MELYQLLISDLVGFLKRKKVITVCQYSGNYRLDNTVNGIRWYLAELISSEVHPGYLYKKPENHPVYSEYSTIGQIKQSLYLQLVNFINEESEYLNTTKFNFLNESH